MWTVELEGGLSCEACGGGGALSPLACLVEDPSANESHACEHVYEDGLWRCRWYGEEHAKSMCMGWDACLAIHAPTSDDYWYAFAILDAAVTSIGKCVTKAVNATTGAPNGARRFEKLSLIHI